MIDRAGLEIRYTPFGYRGFESLTLRKEESNELFVGLFLNFKYRTLQKMVIMKKILIGLLAMTMLMFVGCGKDDPETEDPVAERTVLIYMAAQNNLTIWPNTSNRFAEYDLKEIKKGIESMGDNHLMIYVDKAKDPISGYDDYKPYLLHYRKGELRDSIPLDESMLPCNPATMKTVIEKAFTDYPGKDYGLVLWGHATGWLFKNDSIANNSARNRAYGGTTKNGSNQGSGDLWMNIPTLAKTLKTLPHLKFIFADCCNMMCAECAYELKDVCDYFIGSPAEIPGEGAPYSKVVPAMMEKETFYKSICDQYALMYRDRVPLAVVKSSEMANLANATKTILQVMKTKEMPEYPDLNNLIYYLDRNLYDMNHFIMTYAMNYDLEAEYQSWKQAFDRAVIYKKFAKDWETMNHVNFYDFEITEEDYSGISMFIPQKKLQSTDNKNIKKMGWYYATGYDSIGW